MIYVTGGESSKYPVYANESVIAQKAYGNCVAPIQKKLRWNCDIRTAYRICCKNRRQAEPSGYWLGTSFLLEVL
jgi:hypothetical protein